jgi:hypothetical protein
MHGSTIEVVSVWRKSRPIVIIGCIEEGRKRDDSWTLDEHNGRNDHRRCPMDTVSSEAFQDAQLHKTAVLIGATLAPVIESMSHLNSLVSQELMRLARRIGHGLIELGTMAEKVEKAYPKILSAVESIGRTGWVIPDSFSFCDIWRISDHIENGDLRRVDEYVIEHFSSDAGAELHRMVDETISLPIMANWSEMFREVAWAYENAKYSLVVPAGLAIIEGLVMLLAGQLSTPQTKPQVTWEEIGDTLGYGSFTFISHQSVLRFLQNLWENSDFSGSPPDSLKRHWVLHGRATGFATQADALRMLVAITGIADFHASPHSPEKG